MSINHTTHSQPVPLLARLILASVFTFQIATAATLTGNLVDIGLQPLDTRLIFIPTNEVQISSLGLSAGPPKVLDTTNGALSILLDTGDYAVSLPYLPWRRPFMISVPNTNGTVNLTNLISNLLLAATNNPNYTVKATVADAAPAVLNSKIFVAGALSKSLSTNSGAVSITISNSSVATALDNENIHIGADGACAFGILGLPVYINANGSFDHLTIGDLGEHLLNNDGSFSLANGGFNSDTTGNLTGLTLTCSGDIEITDTTRGFILSSPGGTRYRIKVADDGTLSTEAMP